MMPMLCSPYSETVIRTHDVWMVSEKYDGWRMYYTKGKFYTRAGNEVQPPARIVEEVKRLDPNQTMMLDGELWLGYNKFDEIGAALQNKDAQLVWKLFDMPSVEGGYDDRYMEMCAIFHRSVDHGIEIVHQVEVTTVEEIDKIFQDVIANPDKEGIVIRPADMQYEWGKRSPQFMKRKRIHDLEAEVLQYFVTPLAKINQKEGYVSSLVCAIDAGTFRVSVKTMNPPPIGSIIRVAYQNLSPFGLPRFPVYKGIRDAKDMPQIAPKKPVALPTALPAGMQLFTAEQVKKMKGTLKAGMKICLMGSKNTFHTISIPKAEGALPYCSCPAWKYQRVPPALRVCKHTQLLLDE